MNNRDPKDTTSTPDISRVSGIVERVTYHNAETGFCVLRVSAKGHRDLLTVVGTLSSVTPGEWIDAEGAWTIDPKHGQQLKAQFLRSVPPNTVEGIQKYLGSGLIKGIGPKMAERLVRSFGKDVFNVIENFPRRLTEVEGIGPVRQRKIVAAWAEQRKVREIMVFLHSHGVSTSRAFRIFKTYGDNAVEIVREDPYRLARDIWGIGFKSADQIASSLGIARDSLLRARAGVEYTLQELTNDGHCSYPREQLQAATVKLLEIPEDVVRTALDDAIAGGRLKEYESNQRCLIYLAALDQAERQLARLLTDLSSAPHPLPAIDIAKAIDWVEKKVGLKLADAQRRALALSVESKVLIITGGPGVGKTTLVNAIMKVFRAKKLKVVLCAPTGRAAKRLNESTGLEAKTIHRLLEFEPSSNAFKHDRDHPLKGDIFVVDECSMIDLVLAYQLVRAIPLNAALIFVGDVDQLPSVGPGRVLRDMIESGVFSVARLNEVFRQAAQSAIIMNAHRVNHGEMPLFPRETTEKDDLSDFYFIESDEPEQIVDIIIRLIRDRIPVRMGLNPIEDVQVLTPMQRGELGVRNLNQRLQTVFNSEGKSVERFGWTFRERDKVMQIVNNYDKDVFNGDIGTITLIDEEEHELRVRFDEREVVYDFRELDELVLSYAISIHKSQGNEYPAVIIPIHTQHYMLLQRNLLYTAVTRGRRLVVLVGSSRALAIAVRRIESRTRITTLKERLIESATGTR